MTIPLMVLAVGAVAAGYVGIPAVLGEPVGIENAIEHYLEPSFVAGEGEHDEEAHHMSAAGELSLMAFSILLAFGGILLARRNYVQQPEVSTQWAQQWDGPHRILTNKYYVDELYGATFVAGTMSGARGLFAFDRGVVDGAVNGTGWTTIVLSWISHVLDKYVVDGIVNVIGGAGREASYSLRRVQTGLIQNYAFATVFGVFAFVTWYLILRS